MISLHIKEKQSSKLQILKYSLVKVVLPVRHLFSTYQNVEKRLDWMSSAESKDAAA